MVGKTRRIWAFVKKDLHESIKNRSIFIAVILPVVASLLFGFLDNAQTPKNFTLGIYDQVDSGFTQFVKNTALNFQITMVLDQEEGRDLVRTGQIDGFIVIKEQDQFQVFLDSQRPVYFFALSENITNLIEVYLQVPPRYDLEIIPVGDATVSRSVLPVWITITMSMIGVLNLGFSGWLALVSLIFTGGVCFTAIGLLIGVLSSGQSTARSVATMIYFPLLFPTLISDLSTFTRTLASFFPTFYLFRGIEAILLHGQGMGGILSQLVVLIIFALILLGITFFAYGRMVNALD